MKQIATVNFSIPTVEDHFTYHSGASLLDFDIVVFGPAFPYLEKTHFTNGGNCVSIDSTKRVYNSISHWNKEIFSAVKRGATVFVILDELQTESFATGSTSPRKNEVTYQTRSGNNYLVIPGSLTVRNTRGRKISVSNNLFKPLFSLLEEHLEYRVIIDSSEIAASFIARDGSSLGGVASLKEAKGHLVLLPYFDLEHLTVEREGEEVWTIEALQIAHSLLKQFTEIDKSLRSEVASSPPPDWVDDFALPIATKNVQSKISEIECNINDLKHEKEKEGEKLSNLNSYRALLYATGSELECAIENTLRLLGYVVEGLRIDALEIDHIITTPEGRRMIGEAEGKDNSAISITKFRQLESNINEDFERDEIDEPAAGVLFGNGFRLKDPRDRSAQFTDKCLTNAKRLQTKLVKTSDLYPIAVYLIDNPDDEEFKASCRSALESTRGDVVIFPPEPLSRAPVTSTPPPSATPR